MPILFLILISRLTHGVDANVVQRATNGAIKLRSMMKDPDSFVLDHVYQLKEDKKGRYEICYFYNARNSFGGYGNRGQALLLKNDGIYDIDEKTRSNPFFGAFDSCRAGNRVADITVDVESAIDPSKLKSEQILGPEDRQKMLAAENAGFKKEGVAGYAEIVDDTYIVHSERASNIRFHANMLNNKEYLGALERAGIAQLVYTDDAAKRFVYDVKNKTIVSEIKPETSVSH